MFMVNFSALLPRNKNELTYEEYSKKFLNNLKSYGLEYNDKIEKLLSGFYSMDDETYKSAVKSVVKISYVLVLDNTKEISEITEFKNNDIGGLIKEYFEIYKRAYSIVYNKLQQNYTEFLNSKNDKEYYDNLLSVFDGIVENNMVLDQVYSEYDQYVSTLDQSEDINKITSMIRNKLKYIFLEKCRSEISRYDRITEENKNFERQAYLVRDNKKRVKRNV